MRCWICGKDMELEFLNRWRKTKNGDKIQSGTYVCWVCSTIMKIQLSELNRNVRDGDDTEDENGV